MMHMMHLRMPCCPEVVSNEMILTVLICMHLQQLSYRLSAAGDGFVASRVEKRLLHWDGCLASAALDSRNRQVLSQLSGDRRLCLHSACAVALTRSVKHMLQT
jgi:hypothetical protein